MQVKIKKLNDKAVIPAKAHPSDAGYDMVATSVNTDKYGNVVYGTGIALEIPEGYMGLLYPRSSICKYDLALSNSVGIIDSHYRGEVMAKYKCTNRCAEQCDGYIVPSGRYKHTIYNVGDRIAQLVIVPIPEIEMVEADDLSETDRGAGGYGSSGR